MPVERTEESEARTQRFISHLTNEDPFTTALLKGHLLIEEYLDEIIAAHCNGPNLLDGVFIPFLIKVRFAKALTGFEHPFWACIEALNTLRNEIAHNLEGVQRKRKFQTFVSAVRAVKPKAEFLREEDETALLIGALAYISGFVETMGAQVKELTTARREAFAKSKQSLLAP